MKVEVCDRDMIYEGGKRRREMWWRQTTELTQLSVTLEDILAASRARHWESRSCGEGGGGRKVVEYDPGS